MNRSRARRLSTSVFVTALVLSVGRAEAQSPAVADAGGPYAVDEGATVALDGSGSTTSSPPLSYAWDFDGDGLFDDAIGVAPTLDASGLSGPQQLTIALEVTDAAQFTDTDTVSVTVANLPPSEGYVTGDSTGFIGEALTFSSVATDPGGDPLTWTWSWGDGSPPDSGPGLTTVSHTWSTVGTFLVSVLISDGQGGDLQVGLPVFISNPGPSLLLLSAPSGLGEGVSGQWSVSASDALGNPVFLIWDWGDGSPPDTGLGLSTVSHSYPDDGSWSLVVTAFDVLGAQANLVLPTSVSNLDPAFVGGPPLT
ncbi:MAG: PKD domain-containing protein, partial [Myxococcota bacterium]|nr:PKD domain-containing protein [Myxococcota bacterium]